MRLKLGLSWQRLRIIMISSLSLTFLWRRMKLAGVTTLHVYGGGVMDIISLSSLLPRCNFLYTRLEANILIYSLVKWVKDNYKYDF